MGAVYFYHLTETPLETTLPMLLGKARDAGWRVLVRGTDPAVLDRLDAILWERPEDGFLPHGRAGGPRDADQPILLGDGPSDGFACVMSISGAPVEPQEVKLAERVCVIFDGQDGDAVQYARSQWKDLTAAGCPAQYWAQDGGRWVKKAETSSEVEA